MFFPISPKKIAFGVVFSTHNPDHLFSASHKALILHQDASSQFGNVDDVLTELTWSVFMVCQWKYMYHLIQSGMPNLPFHIIDSINKENYANSYCKHRTLLGYRIVHTKKWQQMQMHFRTENYMQRIGLRYPERIGI